MAVGEFVDYSPGPQPGSFQFAKADGSKLLGTGPQAAQLAQMLERQKAAAPQPVAQAAPQGSGGFGGQVNNAWASDAPPPNPAAPPAAPPPQQQQQQPQPPPQAPRVIDLDQQQPQPPPQEGAPRGPQWQPVGRNETGTIVRDAVTGQLAEMRAGSPGISRAQLQARQGQGVALPSAASESRQGGYDPNPEYLDQIANATIDQKLALNRLSDAQSMAAQAEGDFYRKQQAGQAAFVAQQQKAAAEADELHRRDMAQLEKAQSDVRSSKIDPTRIYSGAGGTLRAIGSAIAAGFGAFGASLARTPNFALDIINRAVDRDIATQEADLANKKGEADNALKRWMSSGADLKTAKAAVRIEQLEAARQQMGEIAANAKLDTVNGTAAQQMAQLDKQLADEHEAYRIKSLGQRNQEVTSRYAYPQGGSRGGVVPISLKDAGTIAGIRKTETEAARGEKPEKPAQDAAAQVAVLDEIGKRLANKPSKGEVFSPEGQWGTTRLARAAANAAFGARTVLPGNEAERAEAAEFDQTKGDLISQNSVANKQGAQTDDEFERNSAAIGEARTWGELQATQQYIRAKAAAQAKAYGVNVTEQPRAEELGMQKRGPK